MWAIAFKENIAFYLYLRFSVITSIKVLLSFMALLFSIIYKTMLLLITQSCLTLRPHGPQHARLPCPSPIPRACSNSGPLSVMPSNHLILCRPPLLLPLIFSSIRVFSNESTLHIRWPKFCSF